MICQDEELIDENVERVIQGKPLTHSLAYLDGNLKRKIGITQLYKEKKAYQKAYRKAYRQKNKDKIKAYQREYQREYQKAYRQRKKKEVKA